MAGLRIVAGRDQRSSIEPTIADEVYAQMPSLPLDPGEVAALRRQADLAASAIMRAADFEAIAVLIARGTGANDIAATITATRIAAFLLTGKL